MPRINERALNKLMDAAKLLDKDEKRGVTRGASFARALCGLMTANPGKDLVLAIGSDSRTFKPADIRVSRTRFTLAARTICLGHIDDDSDGGYLVRDERAGDLPISIALAEQ